MRIEQTDMLGRHGRMVKRWRAVCGCGWVTDWRSRRTWAVQRGDTHLAEFCVDPGPVCLGVFEPESPEWFAARADALGGSEIAAVVDLSPYESRFALWHRKLGRVPEVPVNDEMNAGTLLEPMIVGWFAAQHPEWDVRSKVGTWVHGRRRWQLANPDGIAVVPTVEPDGTVGQSEVLVECKYALHDWQWTCTPDHEDDEIPVYYRCQVQWYLDVLGLAEARVVVFHGSSARFAEYVVRADPEDQAVLRQAGAGFVESLASGVRPDIDGHDRTYEVIKQLHPDIDGGSILVPDEIGGLFCAAKAAEKAAGVESKRATGVLADFMGSAQAASWRGQVIARRQVKRGGVPYVVAAQNLPPVDVDSMMEESA